MILNLKLVNNEPSEVKLYGVDGSLKLRTTIQAARNTLDLGRLKAGDYVLHLSNSILRHTMRIKVV